MKELILKMSLVSKLATFVFITYAAANSLFLDSKIGLFSILILLAYILVNLSERNIHRISFLTALFLISFAVILYVIDITNTLEVPITKLTEWAYLLMLAGTFQLVTVNIKQLSRFLK